MENRWPPDNVNTVSTPLALSRRAMSRPACTVGLDGASMLMPAAYPQSLGYLLGEVSPGGFPACLGNKETSKLGPTPFKPSIDWSTALVDSLRWIAIAWAVGAVCLLAVLVAFRYLTPWGQQFWRITRGYFVGAGSVKAWLGLAVLLLSVLLAVRLTVLLSYQGNDLYTSVQKAVQGIAAGNDAVKNSGIHGFWMSIGIFVVLATIY